MIESPTLVPAEALPYRVDVVEHVAIEMPDGQHLSARLWLPVTDEPVPAILEHLPYRKDDDKLPRDQSQLAWLAGHGYACIRTDLRGLTRLETRFGRIRNAPAPSEVFPSP